MQFAYYNRTRYRHVSVKIPSLSIVKGHLMKKQFIALAVTLAIASLANAQATDTIAKVKASGAITMGVRDSSGALSYTLGDGKYTGYHVEICRPLWPIWKKQSAKM